MAITVSRLSAQKAEGPDLYRGPRESNPNLSTRSNQTNPEGIARLSRQLIEDLALIVIITVNHNRSFTTFFSAAPRHRLPQLSFRWKGLP